MITPIACRPDIWRLILVGAINGLIIGAGLAMAHRANGTLIAIAVAAFITTTYALCRRRAVRR